MDEIDVKILNQLQNNARTSASEIAHLVNLSVPAVSERIKKLDASGIIEQYTTIISPIHLSKQLTAIMYVSLERPRYAENFHERILAEEDVLECHYIAGDYDYSLKIITKNTMTLERLLNRIKSVQGVQKTRTNIVLSTLKNLHSIKPTLPESI
jgi:Lrp/AsnC family leucine-responsive transcriptional regulator